MPTMMTTRERLQAAWRCEDVDYVPLAFHFWPSPRHPRAVYGDERERLAFYRAHEWDARLELACAVSPVPEVEVEVRRETVHGERVLHQIWRTPGGTLEERLRITDDWPQAADPTAGPVYFGDDFRTSRYLEFPFKTEGDLAVLPYLFPDDNARDADVMAQQHRQLRPLADEFAVPLVGYHPAGMDWLIWLFPPEEIILRALTEPAFVQALLAQINRAYTRRLDILLGLGVDGLCRRGWYESTDFWSPTLFNTFARPTLATEIRACRAAGVPYIYLMDSGVQPLLPALAALDFDCLFGVDPATRPVDLAQLRAALPGKALWGGLSGPLHLGAATPAQVEHAVEQAFAACTPHGFALGPAVGIRATWPWENIEAMERAWRRLRGG